MNVVTVNGPLPTSTLVAAAATLAAVLPHWDLGDDNVAMLTLSRELAFDVSILVQDESRADMRAQATARLRKASIRYRRAVAANGIGDHEVDDWALASPDSFESIVEDRVRLAA